MPSQEIDSHAGVPAFPIAPAARAAPATYATIPFNIYIDIYIKFFSLNVRSLFFFAVDYGSHPYHWLLFDRIVQQLILQNESGEDVDGAPLEINVKEIVQLYVSIAFVSPERSQLTSLFSPQAGNGTGAARRAKQGRRAGKGELRSCQRADAQGAGA